ncbi:FkbM family methyltransferase [Demequina sp.]|uniref:FkbM family methyltransferase n=1 Tax=Demequina sp. TaxID=2050685 RepID=UPI0025EA7A1E|nr:FkbM family methyltransferase [Demequina sp.]
MRRAASSAEGGANRPATAVIGLLSRAAWFVEDEVKAIAELVPPGGTCVDVGAGYGLYTAAMSAAVGNQGTVHAIEPQPAAARVIDAVVRICGAQGQVVRHACVLSDGPGTSTLSVPMRRGRAVRGRAFLTKDALHSGPNAEEFSTERRFAVRVSTLDELAAQYRITRLDMIKADVEGAELQVLTGGARTIDAFRPTVQLEIEERHLGKYGRTVSDVTGFLLGRGYTMHGWAGSGWRPAAFATTASRNYLFLP